MKLGTAKRLATLSVLFAIIIGCGGGGGGGEGSNGGFGFTPKAGIYMEFRNLDTQELVDPLNLAVGTRVQMMLTNYDLFGTRTVLKTGTWSIVNGGASFSLNSTKGTFTVLATTSSYISFRTTWNSSLYAQDGRAPVEMPTVSGRGVELGAFTGFPTNVGVPYLQVEFYDAGGNRVGSARTDGDGNFLAYVQLSATHTMVLGDTIKTSHYYKTVYHKGLYYAPLISNCKVPIDALINGPNVMSDPLALPVQSGAPPPPPNGCP